MPALVWKEIRFRTRNYNGADVVILLHPWKRSWAHIFVEDVYHLSDFLFERLNVAEESVSPSCW